MKVLIHDLEEEEFNKLFVKIPPNITIISNNHKINKCIGCFGCWIKTPSSCVIKDNYKDMGKLISQCEELIIISECLYGGYSIFVKNVIDRSISYIHPYFTIRNGEMHHKSRYSKGIKLTTYFYGDDINSNEKSIATKLVKANGLNFNVKEQSVYFYNDSKEMRCEIL